MRDFSIYIQLTHKNKYKFLSSLNNSKVIKVSKRKFHGIKQTIYKITIKNGLSCRLTYR